MGKDSRTKACDVRIENGLIIIGPNEYGDNIKLTVEKTKELIHQLIKVVQSIESI